MLSQLKALPEKRGAPRKRTLLRARIVFNDGRSVIDCVVRNLSDTGAALEIEGLGGIPASFDLEIGEPPARRCEVAWARPGKVGVRFLA